MEMKKYYTDAIGLLRQLISIPSFSGEEKGTADAIEDFFRRREISVNRHLNNIWAVSKYFDASKPTLLLNSHHDTVRPNPGYTKDPFDPVIEEGKLFGLGSNDAGGALVSLISTFCHFYGRPGLSYNLGIAATAEEETSGMNGIESILSLLPEISLAVVGEPTHTELAIAEKGLLVLDCTAIGVAGHAAREEGENAIYKALKDIAWFQSFHFPLDSDLLGPVKMSVTSVNTQNKAHNVVPASCDFIVDIRVTDKYSHEQVLETIKQHVGCQVKPRSMRIRSSCIAIEHPLVQAGKGLGKRTYGSPTSSDAALIPAPVLKCGPGNSARSHTADEFIYLKEIEEGIDTYIKMLQQIF